MSELSLVPIQTRFSRKVSAPNHLPVQVPELSEGLCLKGHVIDDGIIVGQKYRVTRIGETVEQDKVLFVDTLKKVEAARTFSMTWKVTFANQGTIYSDNNQHGLLFHPVD